MNDNSPRLPADLATHFSKTDAYGLYLTVGLAIMLLASCAFGLIASEMTAGVGLSTVDAPLANWLHARLHSRWTPFMLLITHWHQPAGVLVMAALLGGWFYRQGLRYWLLALLLAIPGGMILNVLIKYTFHRARPSFDDPLITLTTYSFPSGHTVGATLFYGLLAAYAVCSSRRWGARAAAVAGAAAMVALVAFSRIYLGVHYLSDVLAAVAEGCAWLALCITAVSALRRRNEARTKQQGE